MDPLVAPRHAEHVAEQPLRRLRHIPAQLRRRAASPGARAAHGRVLEVAALDEHAVPTSAALLTTQGPPREVQVHGRRLEEVVAHLVELVHGADEVHADVPLPVEALEAAINPHVGADVDARVGGGLDALRVDVLLDLNDGGAVVELVLDVGLLAGELADLGDEGDLRDEGAVDAEVGRVGVGLLGGEDLLDCYGAEGVVVVALGWFGVSCALRGGGRGAVEGGRGRRSPRGVCFKVGGK